MKMSGEDVERMNAKRKIHLYEVHKMIDFYQDQMNIILQRSWDTKRAYWIKAANNKLWRTSSKMQQHLQDPIALTYPKSLRTLDQCLSPEDREWRLSLLASAKVTTLVSPEFHELMHVPSSTTTADRDAEFEFNLGFEFGFDCEELSWMIHHALSIRTEKDLRNRNLCKLIAECVGNTKFKADVLVFYKKDAVQWWEQDGIAKIMTWNPDTKEYENIIDYVPDDQTYHVQRWNQAPMLLSDYPDEYAAYFPVDAGTDPKLWGITMQKKFIASICCQIIHTTLIVSNPSPCIGARNIMKQLTVALKGWFLGTLLGERFLPTHLSFEHDTRGPSLIPNTIVRHSPT